MNERQTKIIRTLLLNSNEAHRVQQLADDLHCSEKTVRNDLKIIQEFLDLNSHASINRRPGVGLQLVIEEEEKKQLFNLLNRSEAGTEQDRILEIAYQLLVENKPMTLQAMAGQYYATLSEIRNDLVAINKWVQSFDLAVVSKQRLGSTIMGKKSINGMRLLIYQNLPPKKHTRIRTSCNCSRTMRLTLSDSRS
ncbi:HTH domain-containing protein [Halobacillus salinarum]|uniref:HTH domain-containing protein n=1 Tax=Halobacillus salinarum TaxID=2932257 RepID=A0ABY4EPB0_9BACI|nr:HTH domain-containing protein [Halobacillus salinarum]UOQ45452.1 HTH domain-containing protein [Halobacillus salinarum]